MHIMQQTIGLVAAMPEEIRPVLKKAGHHIRQSCNGFTLYRFSLADRQICLIESGMGAKRAAAATNALVGVCAPGIIINFGFAGAVTGGLAIGDVVVANAVTDYREGEDADRLDIPVCYAEQSLAL